MTTLNDKTLTKAVVKLDKEAFAKKVRQANKANAKREERKQVRDQVRQNLDGKR